MRTVTFILLQYFLFVNSFAQNCEAFKYYGDTLKYLACKEAQGIRGHYQFSREFMEALDRALVIDSTYSYAYAAKSTAYLKSGDFLSWKELIDKAVKYNAVEHLPYRGWCRYQFFRDYEGAIEDIELLDSLSNEDIGYSVNGDYHLHIARAICYKALGKREKAIEILEWQLQDTNYTAGLYDYLHLGVLYLELENYDKALSALNVQVKENDLAENRYYMALAYRARGENSACVRELKRARQLYVNQHNMYDPYDPPCDKIDLMNIDRELQLMQN